MKKTVLSAALLFAFAGSGQAADLMRGSGYSPALVNTFSWIGPYVGGNVGYGWGSVTNNPTKPSGLVGGIQGGYNWQSGQFVFGFEADLQLTNVDDTFAGFKFSNPWFSTIRGRAGYAMNNILFYGTLGLAIGGLKADAGILSENKTETGWAGGVGVEVGLTQNWSARVEYLYLSLGEKGYVLTGVNNGLNENMLRLGLNYHF